MTDSTMPITQRDDFIAAFHEGEMDMSSLKDKLFIVAVNRGSRSDGHMMVGSIHGPYDFFEMIEQVGCMFERDKHHAKITILEKDFTVKPSYLDPGTTDYIQANWKNIISEEILEASLKTYTLEPGLLTEEDYVTADVN